MNADGICGETANYDSEPWPPAAPDMTWSAVFEACEKNHLHFSSNSQIYKFKDCAKIHKFHGTQREYDLMQAAGKCSITPYGRSLWRDEHGKVYMDGIIMEYGTPLDFKTVDASLRRELVSQMISLVHTLHNEKGIVHGDIKTVNMLLRTATVSEETAGGISQQQSLCLCDFGEARKVDEDPELWEGMVTDNYSSPNRCRNWPDGSDPAPEIVDDLYSLGLSIWELYTRRVPFEDWYVDDILDTVKTGQTVDVDELEDLEIRDIVRKYLRAGGAKV